MVNQNKPLCINKIYFLLIFIFSFSFSEDAIKSISNKSDDSLFITDLEYGQMLYENPRGIGCIKCHGKYGKKQFIARYTHKGKEFEINAPTINNLSLEKFTKVLTTKRSSKSIMPTYFLTNDEMRGIHFYITRKLDE